MDNERALKHLDVGVAQINTKRHWSNEAMRMLHMVEDAERQGATLITCNEVSKAQFDAVVALPGWSGHYVINDQLRHGNWGGNAIFWKTNEWVSEKEYGRTYTIDYRRGKKFGRKGKWYKRTLTMACARLRHKKHQGLRIGVQAFHYPTTFNSNELSRMNCARKTSNWAATRIAFGQEVITGGDGNGLAPATEGLNFIAADGPDRLLSSGRRVREATLPFKKNKLSDHNGIFAVIRFHEKPSR